MPRPALSVNAPRAGEVEDYYAGLVALPPLAIMATFGYWAIRGFRAIVYRMSATPTTQGALAVPHKDRRGRRRPVGYDRAATLKPIDLKTHTQLLDEHKIMSGRCRGYFYSWWKGKLRRRRYVVPRDPRTPAQRRSRGAVCKASKAWSENQPLTRAQRDAWYAAAAKIEFRARLYTSGFRTAQQHFAGAPGSLILQACTIPSREPHRSLPVVPLIRIRGTTGRLR